jgi:hypothetical protein
MTKRVMPAIVVLLGATAIGRGADVAVRDAAELRTELGRAEPGTTITLAPGDYGNGVYVRKLRGTKDKPIVIAGADAEKPPHFSGGTHAFHFSGCQYVTLRNVKVTRASANGINADDAGDTENPSTGMVFENLAIEEIGPRGNRDGLKLSGIDEFAVRGCTFSGWGGSAIDMVGCHNGVVEKCRFIGKDGFEQSNAVQAKGGSEGVAIKQNFFKNAGQRAVNLGGNTGLPYFRPKGRNYEAKAIEVTGNHFVGGMSPIAYVSSVECVVRHNTIVNPTRWVVRILQEQTADGFLPCQKGVFESNLIVFDRQVQVFVNVGPKTSPDTFTFAKNAWFSTDGDRRPSLPVKETDGVYQVDPMLSDAEGPNIKVGSTDARLKNVGADAAK